MTITVTPSVEATNVPPRVRLDIAAGSETSTTVTRQDPDGSIVPVRTPDGGPLSISAGTGLLYDYEAPFGQAVTYSSQESPSTVSNSVTVDIADPWLVHPGVPALSMAIDLRIGSLDEEALSASQSVLYAMGRANPIIVNDGTRHGAQSQLTLAIENAAELADIRALIADAGVLLLNVPPSLGLQFDTCYIAAGDVKISRLTTIGTDVNRNVVLPFWVVDRPAGGTTAQRTLADLTSYPMLADVNSAYATLADVLAGP